MSRLHFEDDRVDIRRGPVVDGQAPSGVTWDRASDAPVSGRTPAARHASATGSSVASRYRGSRTQDLLITFLRVGRLTIAEAADVLKVKEGSICGPWNQLEHTFGWIEGTRTYYTYRTSKGQVKREYHRLTPAGAAIAADLTAKRQAGRRP